jgi:hypothetical protein
VSCPHTTIVINHSSYHRCEACGARMRKRFVGMFEYEWEEDAACAGCNEAPKREDSRFCSEACAEAERYAGDERY